MTQGRHSKISFEMAQIQEMSDGSRLAAVGRQRSKLVPSRVKLVKSRWRFCEFPMRNGVAAHLT